MPSQIPVFILRAIVAALLAASCSSFAGSLLVTRGLSFMVSAVSHAALGGAALGIYLQSSGIAPWFNPLLGATLFGLMVAAVTAYSGGKGLSISMEKSIGVSFALSMSLAVFFMYYIPFDKRAEIWGYFVGDILLLTDSDIMGLTISTVILTTILLIFFREFIYVSFDPEGATAFGLRSQLYNYLLLLVTAVSITSATKAVGAILAFTVIVVPAAAASELSNDIVGSILLSYLIASTAELAGIAGSYLVNVSPTAITGILTSIVYLVALLKKRRI